MEANEPNGKVVKSDTEWRQTLTEEQYRVLRQGGTECAFTGAYWDVKTPGLFRCAGCHQPLFDTTTKFNSGTGWPSFYEAISAGRVTEKPDYSHGMHRIEVLCARCDGHLGHLFPDGPRPTGLRYCINSAALEFVPKDGAKEKAE